MLKLIFVPKLVTKYNRMVFTFETTYSNWKIDLTPKTINMKAIPFYLVLLVSSFFIGCEKEPPITLEYPVNSTIEITEDTKEHFVQYDDNGKVHLLSTEDAIASDSPITYVWVFDELQENVILYAAEHEKVGELFPETIGKIEGNTEFRENSLSADEFNDLKINGSKEQLKAIYESAPVLNDPGMIVVNPDSGISALMPRGAGYYVERWEYVYLGDRLVLVNTHDLIWMP